MAQTLGLKQPFRLELPIGKADRNAPTLWFPEWVDFYKQEDSRERHWINHNPWQADGQTLRSQQRLGQVAEMRQTVTQHEARVDLEIVLENITDSPLWRIDQTTCLSLAAAPDYRDPTGDRTYLIMDGQLTATSQLDIEYDHAPGIAGAGLVGEPLPLKDGSTRQITDGVYFIVARDEQSVLVHTCAPARRISYDRRGVVACVHIQPIFDDVQPRQQCQARGSVYLTEGSLADALARYKAG